MPGVFRPTRLRPGFEHLDWRGDQILATVVEASRRAINDVVEEGARIARDEHPWDNDTWQEEDAVFSRPAVLEEAPLRVWGEWGVLDMPREPVRINNPRDPAAAVMYGGRPLSTLDVAMFLEFGTELMHPFPWLYPAWDRTKVELAGKVGEYYREISASGAPTSIRDARGRFASQNVLSELA